MSKKSVWIGAALVAIAGMGIYFSLERPPLSPNEISSFEACAEAGYPVGESHPRQCWTPDGKHFWEEIKEKDNGTVGEFWGTIVGTVLLGPTCPVMQNPPDPECADRPYETRLVLTTADQSKVIKEFSSNSEGTFSIEAPPGAYTIRSASAANIWPHCGLDSFVVPANGSVEVTVSCDTGIR